MFEHIHLRPRSNAEAADLGLMLAREHWPALVGLTLIMLLPIGGLAALGFWLNPAFGFLLLWWFKPTIERPLLHLLSRRAAGMQSGVRQTLAEAGQWWSGGHLANLLLYRFHPERSAVLPVWQLERLTGLNRRRRSQVLAHGSAGAGSGLTLMTSLFELAFLIALFTLIWWLLPAGLLPDTPDFLMLESGLFIDQYWGWLIALYAITLLIIEPFYVGAGFGLYLNQRCRLECWDLEPVFRQIAQRAGGAG